MNRILSLAIAILSGVSGTQLLAAQDLVSLFEVEWANSDAIRNFDVYYKIDISELSEAVQNHNEKQVETSTQFESRLVVSDDPKRILFVRKVFSETKEGAAVENSLRCCLWEEGVGSFVSNDFEGVDRRRQTLFEFYERHGILAVDQCSGMVLAFGIDKDKESERNSVRQRFAATRSTITPGGSIQVSSKISSIYRTVRTYDPQSLMLSSCLVQEFDAKTDATVRTAWRDSPKFELCKNIYRITSCDFSRDRMNGKTIGSASFRWHQFNTEKIAFPEFSNEKLDLLDALEFLKQGCR